MISDAAFAGSGGDGGNSVLSFEAGIVRATPSTPQTDMFTLFRRSINGARGWTGDIGEVLVFKNAKTVSEDAEIRAYLSAKWGIA